MLFTHIGVIDEDFAFQSDCFVGVRGDTIAYVGSEEPGADFGERYDGTGKVLLPGLVNAHSHAPMTLMRGYAENLALDEWLNTMIFPFEAKMTDDEVYPATVLAIAEMLRFGTTSFSDMYYFSDTRARAVLETGIKCNLCDTLIDFAGTPYAELPVSKTNEHLWRAYHGANNGRLLVDMGLHAEYTSTPMSVRTFAGDRRDGVAHACACVGNPEGSGGVQGPSQRSDASGVSGVPGCVRQSHDGCTLRLARG